MARSFFATDFSLFKVKLTKSGSNSNPSFREVLENEWRTMSESTKTIGTIIALNCAVFLAWKIKPLKNFMQTHFTSSPVTGRAWPMLLSAFSHFSALHLGSNMIALASFGAAAHDMLGRNQFLALYFSSAVISSFAGLVAKNTLGRTIPSLGASGAIMSIAFYICTMLPHTHISIIFFPFHPIEAWKGAAGMVALDFLGLVFRWRIFDHAAHLGGAAVGIFYAYKGQELIWGDFYRFLIPHYLETKQAFLKWWKRISGKSF